MNIFSGTNTLREAYCVFISLFNKDVMSSNDARKRYEKKLREYLESRQVYAFASGRMALFSALKSVSDSGEIILPSFTCSVVPEAILHAGYRPVYCDINTYDYNIDPHKIESLITPDTRAIYAQHTFGNMCDIDQILAIAKKYSLLVIEDAALSLGAKHNGKHSGTIGDFGYFSTDRSKVICTGQGGILTINNKSYLHSSDREHKATSHLSGKLNRVMAIAFILDVVLYHPNFYWIGKYLHAIFVRIKLISYPTDGSPSNLISRGVPYPVLASGILSEVGMMQLDKIGSNLKNREKLSLKINKILKIYTDNYIKQEENVFLRYSFLVKNRDFWEREFSSVINLGIWFKTVISGIDKKSGFQDVGYVMGENSNSEYCAKHIFNIPTHNHISFNKIEHLLIRLKESGDIITKERVL